MGQSPSSGSIETSASCKPHEKIDDYFLQRVTSRVLQRVPPVQSPFSLSPSCPSPGDQTQEIQSHMVERVKGVTKVYWCSQPLNELGAFKVLSPRWLPRRLAWRQSRELEGPATWELGHSYAIVDVELLPEAAKLSGQSSERYRLNWGAGRRVGTNLAIERQDHVPESKIMGDRLEKVYPGTCTGKELHNFLKKWDGSTYDANAANNRNCHHFMQELIHACTRHAGHEDADRPEEKDFLPT
ncbi:unnamed protein product [Durusdinium trenchii]|uniref:PPPDE domain-containing protein n=1 Tax=Durusdinium trenchii TaxID=1381693 RepID=A0ABP0NGM9_9DINO